VATQSILLIYPPVAKPCEAPAGLAKLAFALRAHGVDCRTYDANLDTLLGTIAQPRPAEGTWSRRAVTHRQANLEALRSHDLYGNRDRYKRAVMDTARVLQLAGRPVDAAITLSNYTTSRLSPVRSADLINAAENFKSNPFHAIFAATLRGLFAQRTPDIVGLSIGFMSQALCAFAMIGFVKQVLPGARLVCGGGLVTSWLAIPGLGNPFAGLVDEMVRGPGEPRLLELCTGQTGIRSSVAGYDYAHMDLDRYLAPTRVLPYAASRGCYWKKCAFCPENSEGGAYLSDDPQAVGQDLDRSALQTSPGLIHFLDNALSPRLMQHLIDHPPAASWYGFARITRHLCEPDFVRGLRASGCLMLKLGVESGDQQVLDALCKGIAVATVSQALQTIHQAGIATYVYLLFGTPAENEASARRTLAFTRRHARTIDFLNLAIFNLPAYSREAGHLETVDFYKGDLSLYREFIHPAGWHRDRVRRFVSKSVKKSPVIRPILNRDPPFFTSNHAPFFIETSGSRQ
jgi:hypothetical protein